MRLALHHVLWYGGHPWERRPRGHFANYEKPAEGRKIALAPRHGWSDSTNWPVERKYLAELARATGDPKGSRLLLTMQWVKPWDRSDVNLSAWLFHVLRHFPLARWCIFYDPVLAVRQRNMGDRLDFDVSGHFELWAGDLAHLEPLTRHGQYWRPTGRPALWVWAVHGGVKNADATFALARESLFLVGDVFGRTYAPPLDAYSGFVSVVPGVPRRIGLRECFNRHLLPAYERGWPGPVIPALSCQYDETAHLGSEGKQVLARDRAEIAETISRASAFAPEIDGERVMALGTTNVFFECSTVYSTKRDGPAFLPPGADGLPARVGNYGREHLRAIREALQ